MSWLVDASYARHSGMLAHHLGLLPALDRLIRTDEDCLVVASPELSDALGAELRRCSIRTLEAAPGLARFLSLNLRLRRHIRAAAPGALLAGQYAPMGAGVPYVLRMTDAHLVAHAERRRLLRFYTPVQRLQWRAKVSAFTRSVRSAAGVLCATRAVRDQLLDAHPELDPGRVRVARYGPSRVADGRTRHPGPRGRRLLTMHVTPRKNIEVVLEALALPEMRDWTLTVLGDIDRPRDRYTRFLAGRVRALGLEGRVVSLGYVADVERLLECMLEHDVLVSTSRIESWNHTVVEALGIGMPAIASEIACHREVAGGAAWLVDPDDPRGIRNAVAEIVSGSGAVTDRLERGRRVVGGYSWREYAAAAVTALREAAAS